MQGFSGQGIRYLGFTFLLFPVWYPVVEEDGLRWPQAGDLPYYAFVMAMGAAFLFWASRLED